MRKTLFSIITLSILIFQVNTFAQMTNKNGMMQVYSGYGQTAYNMEGYDAVGYMPLGIRGAIGVNGLSLGADYWTDVIDPKFGVSDSIGNTIWKERISNSYIGGMLRAQMADDPRSWAVLLRVGVGVYVSTKAIKVEPNYVGPQIDGEAKYGNSIGYNAGIGLSLPFREGKTRVPSNIHLTMEGQFNYNPRKYGGLTNQFTSWQVQIGISYNFFNGYNLGHY